MKFSSLPILLKLYILLIVAASGVSIWATTLLAAAPSPAQHQHGLTLALMVATMVFSTWKVRLTINQSAGSGLAST